MSGGLQRRRVVGTPQSSDANASDGRNSVNGSRDFDVDDTNEDKYAPRLTLMEEVLLLGLKDKQGYLSFWNDNISYVLRGCILMELSLRNRIAVIRDPGKRKPPLSERCLEVVDDRLTGEVLLDETIKMIKASEKMSIGSWIDLMSGETWNVTKIGYQLKQVRERLAKGLVDKGVLRTEKRNFLLFDMATHPVADASAKEELVRRLREMVLARNPPSRSQSVRENLTRLRTMAAICAAYAANVLDNAFSGLPHDAREQAYARVDDLFAEYSVWPPGSGDAAHVYGGRNESTMIGAGEKAEKEGSGREVISAVLNVFTKMDSLL